MWQESESVKVLVLLYRFISFPRGQPGVSHWKEISKFTLIFRFASQSDRSTLFRHISVMEPVCPASPHWYSLADSVNVA